MSLNPPSAGKLICNFGLPEPVPIPTPLNDNPPVPMNEIRKIVQWFQHFRVNYAYRGDLWDDIVQPEIARLAGTTDYHPEELRWTKQQWFDAFPLPPAALPARAPRTTAGSNQYASTTAIGGRVSQPIPGRRGHEDRRRDARRLAGTRRS